MKPIRTFSVVPALPPELEPLREIAMNLRWAWDHDSVRLFRRLDPELWVETNHNPVALLARIAQERLEELAADREVVEQVARVADALRGYLADDDTWYRRQNGDDRGTVAYFSAEFGVTGCLSIFAGGLGMLAGDHLKSASDLDLPLVGVGLLYQQGYFEQRLNDAGWQQEVPATNDFEMLPLTLERNEADEPVTVELGFPDGAVVAQVWRAQVGRVPLYLLDTNVPANTEEQRRITEQLYGGADETRIRQEILLGIGGYRALEALGIAPGVYHMNEGHSAFLALERIRRLMEVEGVSFETAREAASAALVFTTHTPVEAGHDYFPEELLAHYFSVYVSSLGMDWSEFVGLGRQRPDDDNELFCMTVLALRLAARSNAVSKLHGETTRAMWRALWPELPEHEIPIGHVTNGVHLQSWLSRRNAELLDDHIGDGWRSRPANGASWGKLDHVDDEELWRLHQERRARLVGVVRRRLQKQLVRRGAPASQIAAAEEALDPNALTIGFARRFATYKRATLFARDADRLARILGDPLRPVQIIVAGKAHPRDDAGKELIRQIAELSLDDRFSARIVFVEDYGMSLARYLVSGCDVWLNNPVRPREASGTSGMKAAANGVLNLSTLDGWWDEAWEEFGGRGAPIGWVIGDAGGDVDEETRDRVEAAALYDLLEHDVIPVFYDRDEQGLPRGWVARMKAARSQLSPIFDTHRMVAEYDEAYYRPARVDTGRMHSQDLELARSIAAWRARIAEHWRQVHCETVEAETPAELRVGESIGARARVHLGSLEPDDVVVELYLGSVGPDGTIGPGTSIAMDLVDRGGDEHVYEARGVTPDRSGRYGFTVRVRAVHRDAPVEHVPGALRWATGDD